MIIVTLGVFSVGATNATGGGIPQNDDWSFTKAALLLHQTGDIHLQGWNAMFLLGQLYTAQPFLTVFGERVISLNLYGVTMTALWLWCAFLIGRRCVGPRRAVLLVGVLALWPGLSLLASSFMTDMPAAAVSLLTIVLGIRTVERNSRLWLVLTLLAGLWAFTIREQFVVCIAAVLVGVLASRSITRRLQMEAVVAVALTAILCAVLERARHQLAHADPSPFGLHSLDLSAVPPSVLRVPFTIGLDVAPLMVLVLFSLRGRGWLDVGRLVGWAVGLLALVSLISGDTGGRLRVVLSNYFSPNGGFVVTTVGARPVVFGPTAMHLAQLIAAVSGVLILGEVGASLRGLIRSWPLARAGDPTSTMLGTYTALLAGITVALSFAGQLQVDRYQVPILVGVSVLLLRIPPQRRARRPVQHIAVAAPVAALAALLAFLAVRDTLATDRRDGAIWSAATWLTRQGVPASNINAGLDWDGFHAPGAADRSNPDLNAYTGQHWKYLFPTTTDCYVVAIAPEHRTWLTLLRVHSHGSGGDTLRTYTYRNERCRR